MTAADLKANTHKRTHTRELTSIGEEIELVDSEYVEFVRLNSEAKYIGCIPRDDPSITGDECLDYSFCTEDESDDDSLDDEFSVSTISIVQSNDALPTRMLVVDELDNTKGNKLLSSNTQLEEESRSILPYSVRSTRRLTPCPCCRSYIHYHEQDISKGSRCIQTFETDDDIITPPASIHNSSALSAFMDTFWSQGNSKETQSPRFGSMDDSPAQTTGTTTCYEVKKSIVEGWLHKKGTGQDVFRSRSWKPRWVNLVLASIPGYQVDVPVLLVSWHWSLPKQSNVIILDSKVAVAVDQKATDTNATEKTDNEPSTNSNDDPLTCFDIVDTQNDRFEFDGIGRTGNTKATRSFSAPSAERNQWVHEITRALLDYEKRKSQYRKRRARQAVMDDNGDSNVVWDGDGICRTRSLPPTSPPRIRQNSVVLEGLQLVRC